MQRVWEASKQIDAPFFRYVFYGGTYGRQYNRTSYTIATSVAFGLKGYLPHYQGGTINKTTGELDLYGKIFEKINGAYTKVGPELIKIGMPRQVYSTPIGTLWKKGDVPNDNKDPAAFGLVAIPKDYWVQVKQGETVFGVFEDDNRQAKVTFANAKKISLFDREKGVWKTLVPTDGVVSFTLPGGMGELLRVER